MANKVIFLYKDLRVKLFREITAAYCHNRAKQMGCTYEMQRFKGSQNGEYVALLLPNSYTALSTVRRKGQRAMPSTSELIILFTHYTMTTLRAGRQNNRGSNSGRE
jgi:hypothetical protein